MDPQLIEMYHGDRYVIAWFIYRKHFAWVCSCGTQQAGYTPRWAMNKAVRMHQEWHKR
jgi:hypothetical protein